MFVDPDYARSIDYVAFWEKLGRGQFDARDYKQVGRNGKEVWIQAFYCPIRNSRGKIVKILNVAGDISSAKVKPYEFEANVNAISRAQAIVELTTSGEIITANANFLTLTGYSLEEIRGRSYRIFVDPTYADSDEYADFWSKLNNGEFVADEVKRLGKGGVEVWIQASYNPIFDLNNKVVKIVLLATDVTNRILAVEDIGHGLSKLTQAFGGILASMTQIAGFISEISKSPPAQAMGLEQSATSINQIDQQSAAMIEETTAAASSLKSEAEALANLIGRLDTGDQESPPRPPPAVRSPDSTVVHLSTRRAVPMRGADDPHDRPGDAAATRAFPSSENRS